MENSEKMKKPRRKMIGLSGLIVLGMLSAFAIGFGVQAAVFASPTAPQNTQVQADKGTTGTEKGNIAQLKSIFLSHFTARLGIDEAKLNAALLGAVSDTADQAVRDGLATQDQIDQAKKMARAGFSAFLDEGFSGQGSKIAKDAAGDNEFNPKDALFSGAAKALGLTKEQLLAGLDGTKSLGDIAAAHSISADTLKSTILTELKTALDAAVKANKTTQANADEIYIDFSTHINDIVTGIVNGAPGDKK